MGNRTCPIETDGKPCGKTSAKTDSRDWCPMHRTRWYRHGDVHHLGKFGLAKTATPEERFWAKVDAEGDCWIWTGATINGYGAFADGTGKRVLAHRYAYALLVGKIPDGLTLDHLCRNPPCLNPDHLEPVTLAENVRRAQRNRRNQRLHCPQGHPYSGTNLYVNARGLNVCRTCMDTSRRRYLEKKNAA